MRRADTVRQAMLGVLSVLAMLVGALLVLFGGGCLLLAGRATLQDGEVALLMTAASLAAIPIAAGVALYRLGRKRLRGATGKERNP